MSGGHVGLVPVVVLAVAAVAAYALFVLARPIGRCGRCHGKRVERRGGRARKCPRCEGRGVRVRFGATAVHRLRWAAAGDRAHDRAAGIEAQADLDKTGRRVIADHEREES